MIVETMNESEMIKYLSKIENEICPIVKRIVERSCLHKKKGQWVSLGTRSKVIKDNRYYYSIKAQRASVNNRPMFNIEFVPYVVLTRDTGKRCIVSFDTQRERKSLRIYEFHVFERYRERFLKDINISLADSIRIFFERNNLGFIRISPGGHEYAKTVNDGVLLCDEDFKRPKGSEDTTHWKTFITEEMLKKEQSLLSKYGEVWRKHEEFILNCDNDRLNGSRVLNMHLNDYSSSVREFLEKEI